MNLWMHLKPDWLQVAKRAWSFRLAAVAGLLSGCELILPMFVYDMPRGWFAAVSLLVSIAAMVARLVAQRNMST